MLGIMLRGLLLLLLLQPGGAESIRQLLQSGELAAAERRLEEALRQNGDDWRLLVLAAELRLRQQRPGEAETALERALDLAPGEIEPYVQLSRLRRAQARPAAARDLLDQGRSRLGEHPALLYELAVLAAEQSQFLQSLALLSRIPSTGAPDGYWEALGRVQAALENYAEAERAYQRLLERRPQSIGVMRALSGFALKQEEHERAWEYMSQARRIAPNSPEVLYDFSRVSLTFGLAAEAVNCARLLLFMEPGNRDYQILLARSLMAGSAHDEARKWLESRLAERPDDGEMHLLAGISMTELGDFSEAEQHLRRARELLPGDPEPIYFLGLVAYNRTQDEEAERHFQAVLEQQPEHGGVWLTLGKLRFRQGRLVEAQSCLEEAARLLPANPDPQFQLSRLYRQAGDTARAQESIQRYQQLKQQDVAAAERAASLPYTAPDRP